MKVTVTKVDNGYIVEVVSYDFVTKRPETSVYIESTLDGVVDRLRQA